MSRVAQQLASLVALAVAVPVASCSLQADQGRAGTERQTRAAESPSPPVAAAKPTRRPTPDLSCQVTGPRDVTAVPPVVRRAGGDWYGQDDLWVSTSSWRPDPANFAHIDGSYRVKYASVTLDEGELTSRFGPPEVQATRLDGSGTATVDVGGYGSTSSLQFWPTVIDFSDPGCWLVTSSLRKTVVRFVVNVL